MDGTAGDNFSAGGNRANDDHVTMGIDDRLAGADRFVDQQGGTGRTNGRLRLPGDWRWCRPDWLFCFRRLEHACRLDLARERRQTIRKPVQRNALNGDEPQVTFFDKGDDLNSLGFGGRDAGEVEHQWPVGEEAQGVLHPAIQLNEPIHKGQLRGQDKGQIGPAH